MPRDRARAGSPGSCGSRRLGPPDGAAAPSCRATPGRRASSRGFRNDRRREPARARAGGHAGRMGRPASEPPGVVAVAALAVAAAAFAPGGLAAAAFAPGALTPVADEPVAVPPPALVADLDRLAGSIWWSSC